MTIHATIARRASRPFLQLSEEQHQKTQQIKFTNCMQILPYKHYTRPIQISVHLIHSTQIPIDISIPIHNTEHNTEHSNRCTQWTLADGGAPQCLATQLVSLVAPSAALPRTSTTFWVSRLKWARWNNTQTNNYNWLTNELSLFDNFFTLNTCPYIYLTVDILKMPISCI